MPIKLEENFFAVESFEEVRRFHEAILKKNEITTLYKIRNWRELYHPEFLKEGQIYFPRPNELNDPFDIHTPLNVDIAIIDQPDFLKRLIERAPEILGVNPGRDAEAAAENHLDEIRKNPTGFFLDSYNGLIQSKNYNDSIGVLSLTTRITNKQLWGYYGGGLKGFAVGFYPMAIAEELFSNCRPVKYADEFPLDTVINRSQKNQHDLFYQKTKEWEFETEFRFTRILDPNNQARRIHYYKPESVKEIILGPRIVKEDISEIMKISENRYPHAIIYHVKCDYLTGMLYLEKY